MIASCKQFLKTIMLRVFKKLKPLIYSSKKKHNAIHISKRTERLNGA
jgi:hypothetical protein